MVKSSHNLLQYGVLSDLQYGVLSDLYCVFCPVCTFCDHICCISIVKIKNIVKYYSGQTRSVDMWITISYENTNLDFRRGCLASLMDNVLHFGSRDDGFNP